ncbi:10757_t:CDS:2, partial [Acaulospora morrowiae]
MTGSQVEDILKRLQANKHVQSVIIFNEEGQIIKSTMDTSLSEKYSDLVTKLIEQTTTVIQDIDDTNSLSFMRIRTKKHEIMVAP